jgi:hypothetical protein
MPTEPLLLVHHHPGRLRVRADAFRVEGAGALDRARDAAERQPGVRRVRANAVTGSLLVEYQPGSVEPGAILAALAAAAGLSGVIDEDSVRRARPDAAVVVARAVRKVDHLVRELSGGRAHLRTVFPAALLIGAAVGFARQGGAPRWENLAYWSYAIFRDLNREVMAEAEEE